MLTVDACSNDFCRRRAAGPEEIQNRLLEVGERMRRLVTARHVTICNRSFGSVSTVEPGNADAVRDRVSGAKPWSVYWHSSLGGGEC